MESLESHASGANDEIIVVPDGGSVRKVPSRQEGAPRDRGGLGVHRADARLLRYVEMVPPEMVWLAAGRWAGGQPTPRRLRDLGPYCMRLCAPVRSGLLKAASASRPRRLAFGPMRFTSREAARALPTGARHVPCTAKSQPLPRGHPILRTLNGCNRRSLALQSADQRSTIRGCQLVACSLASPPDRSPRPCRIRRSY